jgi:prepilin-type N-terminal cleavage/methylation domain-containing protein
MKNNQKGFSLIELLIVVAIILIIAAIAIPNLLRSKMAANEASAVASLRTLNTTIVEYSNTYTTDPPSIAAMGPATTPSSTSADLVDSVLASGTKSGYTITYTPASGSPVYSYTMTAVPASSSTGQRKFFTDQSGVIRQTTDGSTPTSSSTPIG